jgi:hypothetical protein
MVLPSLLAALAAAAGVQPLSGESVTGTIAFPRAQKMSLTVLERDRLALRLGFDGRCDGGGLGELWMSFVPARETLEVRGGRFAGKLTGTSRGVGGTSARTAHFTWRVSGRFTDHRAATATIAGSAIVREGRKAIARCEIARPATATLARAAK